MRLTITCYLVAISLLAYGAGTSSATSRALPDQLLGEWIHKGSSGDTLATIVVEPDSLTWEQSGTEARVFTAKDLSQSPDGGEWEVTMKYTYARGIYGRYAADLRVVFSLSGDSLIVNTDALNVERERTRGVNNPVQGVRGLLLGDKTIYSRPARREAYERLK